ncbi:Protein MITOFERRINLIKE 1 [Hibiscus syriacus]|uniref:Protein MITOFERRINLIKE 1 n=1 Tax=Hibiscus syriacus TaxID=106335 RepID=A0A6A3BPM2_HIBSY|nr:protein MITOFERRINLIKE 1, chloroplastic-like [Hibiscus syriacus]KAE8718593.1 Protein MITOFERRINLIKE 1 [Hibiscus syriacus]
MEERLSASVGLPSLESNQFPQAPINTDFASLFTRFTTLTSSSPNPKKKKPKNLQHHHSFASTSISADSQSDLWKPKFQIPLPFSNLTDSRKPKSLSFYKCLKPTSRNNPKVQTLMKNLSVFERALIGAGGGGIAGAFTYVCLLPLDTIKTKMQTKGASQIYANTFDAVVKTFQTSGILGFYRGVSAVIVGSTASSAVYFGTCEFGKSFLSKLEYPSLLIPPTAGAMGNIVSSAIMVPKELVTQRMQAGAKGRSWEVLLRILEKDGILGLYAGYSATLLRNLPAGVLSYSSFEYLKAAVLSKTKQTNLEPIQSVCCGAMAGAISASLTTPLDVVKTRLMTQVHGNKVTAAMYSGVNATVKQILKEEGWIGLTSGMGPRVVHSACFSALGYFAFETARLAILDQYLKHKEELSKIDIAPA